MRLGRMLAAAAVSASLVSSPVLAASSSASALGSATSVRAGADMQDQSDLHGGFIIPLLVLAAVVLAVVIIVDDGDGAPASP